MGKPSQRAILIAALRDIADPMVGIRKQAEDNDATVNDHYAIILCNDANWLKQKAKDALDKVGH